MVNFDFRNLCLSSILLKISDDFLLKNYGTSKWGYFLIIKKLISNYHSDLGIGGKNCPFLSTTNGMGKGKEDILFSKQMCNNCLPVGKVAQLGGAITFKWGWLPKIKRRNFMIFGEIENLILTVHSYAVPYGTVRLPYGVAGDAPIPGRGKEFIEREGGSPPFPNPLKTHFVYQPP